jgi:diaminohydroxyphosphoribosylaminopyrimidine deaminase/5-amino-6-(5-phosphoribosylamino)uracil reductase
VDIGLALALLWRERVRSILCEGGGKLAASLLEADLVQRMYLFHAPLLLGPAGPPAFPLRRESQGWTLVQTARYGADTMLLLDRESGR